MRKTCRFSFLNCCSVLHLHCSVDCCHTMKWQRLVHRVTHDTVSRRRFCNCLRGPMLLPKGELLCLRSAEFEVSLPVVFSLSLFTRKQSWTFRFFTRASNDAFNMKSWAINILHKSFLKVTTQIFDNLLGSITHEVVRVFVSGMLTFD